MADGLGDQLFKLHKSARACVPDLGRIWVFRDSISGFFVFRVVSVKNQERIRKAWSLVTKAEMQIGDGQPCLSVTILLHTSSFLVCQQADVGCAL